MKIKKKLKRATVPRVKVKFVYDKSLDEHSGKVLFPEKLKQANEMLSKTVNLDEILKKKPS
jgi:hypothetical protein